ncbi:branched-chain amino acid ABC transporter permease [Vineibacter terrae]|uniref:Branched-chain amino acid ABC transporter permease n=1 Tax=Vineibacter terrae TaxID=2586908 RepID=A0A5C8P810_9HYPH|nr:branched-chain amino acid ABC transporter permease [Vineibacter terrae]TXL69916.1 branched-chain amino acid ABC transporter permease [Vineibacter terrae]
MTALVQTLVNGLLYGGILSIAAVGFSLIFGVMSVINLTHGIFVIGGAYGALVAWSVLGIDPLLSIPPLMLVAFALGWACQRLVIQPAVERGNPVAALLVTFGFALIAVNLLTVTFSSSVRSISPSYSFINLRLGDISIDLVRLVAFGCGLALIAILGSFLRFSRWGRVIRATALSELGARLCGVDARAVYAMTFAVASAFAAASGVLIGMMLPFTPADEVTWTVYAFIVVTLGGVGSLGGAMLGGLLLGLVSTLTQTYLGAVYTNMVMFLILLFTLLVRPNGILGSAFKASR